MTEIRFVAAVGAALGDAMAADHRVVLLGEDISFGGPFGATRGLRERFGSSRVIDTPISEATIMGVGVGAAVSGLRPVVEVMFMDFVTLATDQLVNHAAKLHYMSGGQLSVPLTVRMTFGVGKGFGAHHSQSLESWFAHVPGLKIVAPATPADARTLLAAAIREPDPVLVLEHRSLYWTRGPDASDDALPIDRAAIVRPGRDLTIVAYSKMVAAALAATERLDAEGVDAEVIDLRSLAPLDLETVVSSVRRTGRLLIAHEAIEVGGIGAELAAQVQHAAFKDLRAPIERLGAPAVPVPTSPELEAAYVPSAEQLVERALVLAGARRHGL